MAQLIVKNVFKHYYKFVKDSTIFNLVLKLFSDYTNG